MSDSGSDMKLGIFINNGCMSGINEDIFARIADSLYFAELTEKEHILYQKELGKPGTEYILRELKKFNFTKLIIAGYSKDIHERDLARIARDAELEYGCLAGVPLPVKGEQMGGDEFVASAVSEIEKEAKRLRGLPAFEKKSVNLRDTVLIVGGGVAGIEAASACGRLGYGVVLVDEADVLGGDLRSWKESKTDFSGEKLGIGGGVDVRLQSSVQRLTGSVGNYIAEIETVTAGGMERNEVTVGAVILTQGLKPDILFPEELYRTLKSSSAEPIENVVLRIKEMTVIQRVRNIGLVLDLYQDETKASTEMALAIADSVQDRDRFQVHIFLRDVRVGAKGLQQYYDDIRGRGVNIVKYNSLEMTAEDGDGDRMRVTAEDAVLGGPVDFICDLVGISGYGLPRRHDNRLMEITGVLPDRVGEMQENNIHLFPIETNRPGIFIAGAGRGTRYIPSIIEEARAAALAVHSLLKDGTMEVVCNEVQVDPDKCILCLTCVRCCPYKAMHIDRENSVAKSYPEECQKCGICAGECPAKAITLPEYSDEIMAAQLRV